MEGVSERPTLVVRRNSLDSPFAEKGKLRRLIVYNCKTVVLNPKSGWKSLLGCRDARSNIHPLENGEFYALVYSGFMFERILHNFR